VQIGFDYYCRIALCTCTSAKLVEGMQVCGEHKTPFSKRGSSLRISAARICLKRNQI
jgi:hypothetical protein